MNPTQGALFIDGHGYTVQPISRVAALPFICEIHYAKRVPSISYSFGLYLDALLVGVCTFGVPPSSTLLSGVCGAEYAKHVLELNRLCLKNNLKNEASRLVGGSLKMLGNKIIVSYADTKQNHVGYVYQATNAIYTGISTPFKEVYVVGKEHLHHATHKGHTFKEMEDMYGKEGIGFRERSPKHRYIFIVGSKTFKKKARGSLRYADLPYPKQIMEQSSSAIGLEPPLDCACRSAGL